MVWSGIGDNTWYYCYMQILLREFVCFVTLWIIAISFCWIRKQVELEICRHSLLWSSSLVEQSVWSWHLDFHPNYDAPHVSPCINFFYLVILFGQEYIDWHLGASGTWGTIVLLWRLWLRKMWKFPGLWLEVLEGRSFKAFLKTGMKSKLLNCDYSFDEYV